MNINIEEEILDIVDEHNTVMYSQKRSEYYANKKGYIRSIAAFIKNSKGQLWIPRRVASKKLSPLFLDASVCGHVSAGETYDQAFSRETMEEVGIDVTKVSHHYFGIFGPQQGLTAFCAAYRINAEQIEQYNQQDFCEYYWLTIEELWDRIKKGDHLKSDPLRILEIIGNSL